MAMAKSQSLQDPFLNALRKEKVPVSIYLVNGIKLQGQIDSFDHTLPDNPAFLEERQSRRNGSSKPLSSPNAEAGLPLI
jgi:hypothetical protein